MTDVHPLAEHCRTTVLTFIGFRSRLICATDGILQTSQEKEDRLLQLWMNGNSGSLVQHIAYVSPLIVSLQCGTENYGIHFSGNVWIPQQLHITHPSMSKTFSLQEISSHNTEKDCWVVVDGNIYDVTSFLPEHPGGKKVSNRSTSVILSHIFNPFHFSLILIGRHRPIWKGCL